MLVDDISNTPVPSQEALQKFEEGFKALVEETGVAAAYFIVGSSPIDEEQLELRTGGEDNQVGFLRMMITYADTVE